MFSKKNIKLCHEIVETKLQSFGMPCGGRCYDTDAHLCKKKFSIDADIEKKKVELRTLNFLKERFWFDVRLAMSC
jgi:hypothetical protein